MSAIKYFFDREQRRKRAIERWESQRAERIEADAQEYMASISASNAVQDTAKSGRLAYKLVDDHSEFTARVLCIVAGNIKDECAIGHAVKALVEHHLYDKAERKEDNRVITIEDPDDE